MRGETAPRPMEWLEEIAHRPWPLPERPWSMAMRWSKLAFLHWSFDAELVAARLPAGLELDLFEGRAWIGIVPFQMSGVRPRGTPGLPGWRVFPEINLRTYVRVGDKPGVWFFSLDVPKRLVVWHARRTYHLPYQRAAMTLELAGDEVRFMSRRIQRGAPRADFAARYRPKSAPTLARPGSLEAWLTERYCLYSVDSAGSVLRGDVHHRPWPLQSAEVVLEEQRFFEQIDLGEPLEEPLAHYSESLDTVAWAPRPVEEDSN